jgi:hypothetical protein
MLGFLTYLAVGALRYPDSILRPRLVYLFFRGLEQHVKRPVGRRANSRIIATIGRSVENRGVEL